MSSKSRMREDANYYVERREATRINKRLRKHLRQEVTQMNELEALRRLAKFRMIEDTEDYFVRVIGANRFCIYCKKGNGEKILDCKSNACAWFENRVETEKVEKEKLEEIKLENSRD